MKMNAKDLIMLLKLAHENNCDVGALPLAIEWLEKADKALSELVKTLEPFARVGKYIPGHWPDDGLVTEDQRVFNRDKKYPLAYYLEKQNSQLLTVAEYRRAKTVLERSKQ